MHTPSSHRGTYILGSVVVLLIAMALALASGDALLVLAVATAIGGISLLVLHRPAEARRPSAVPIQAGIMVDRTPQRARARVQSRRMASPRYASRTRRRLSQADRSSDSAVAEAPSQAQIIQVFQ